MALHRLLEGDEDAPVLWEWWISRLCEEFSCLPSQAEAELRRTPIGLLHDILELRLYARSKALYDAATTAEARSRLPDSKLMDLVQEHDFALAQAAIDQANARR